MNSLTKDYSNQNLSSIPEKVFAEEQLKELDVSYNQIDNEVSEQILKLSKLEKLDLKHNSIKVIPEFLVKMNSLKFLDLSSNLIEQIPRSLLKLTNLEKLNLANNEVSRVKGFSLMESPKEMIVFLIDMQEKREKIPLNEAKLLIVGDENSGKSSLVERMVFNRFTAEYNSTKGIDISNYDISKDLIEEILCFYCFGFKIEPNIKINIWDFAGQEITYQLHNLFMSQESLYLLVLDGQKEDNIAENFTWLENISAYANNPPIMIVVTKHDSNLGYEIDEALYREEFPNIHKKIHYVSSKDNFGFCDLKKDILSNILNFSKQQIPQDYIPIKSDIEKLKEEKKKRTRAESKAMLTKEEFKDICEDNELLNEIDNIRTVLNDIGTIIGFNDDNDHIINPPEMIDKIYEIIRSKDMNDEGKLDKRKDKDSYYNWIIEFLLRNKIALEIEKSKILIPSRLSVKKPKNFLKENYMRKDIDNGVNYGLNFRYQYKRFNKSFFFEFFIKMKEYIDDENTKYWANGISWNFSKYKAVVLASKVHRTIDIHLSNNSLESRKFLTIIRKKLDEINKGHRGILKKIAVVDENNEVFYKSYSFLKRMQERENREVVLNIKGNPKSFKLSDLLDRYEYVEDEIDDGVKPLIITEGKTDWKHLKKALERFQNEGFYRELDIQFKEYEDEIDMGEDNLNHMLKANIKDKPSRKKIFIFDRDTKHKDVKEYQKVEFTEHSEKVYSLCIPKINNLDGICIEFYYQENDLISVDKSGRRLFLGKEFLLKANGNSKCGKFQTREINKAGKKLEIIDNAVYLRDDFELKNSIALSKNNFAENVLNNLEGFDTFNIENFKLIFDVIEKIIALNNEKLKLNNEIKEEEKLVKYPEKEKNTSKINIEELIDTYNKDVVKIIQAMQNGSIENFEEIKIELAQELRKIMQQSAKTWSKAKKKALDRKVYIEGLLQ